MSAEKWYTLIVDGNASPPMTAAAAGEAAAYLKAGGIGTERIRRAAKDPGRICLATGDRRRCGGALCGAKTTTRLGWVTCPSCKATLTSKRRQWWLPRPDVT